VTREFFALIRAHLRPGCTLIINVGHLPSSNALEKVVLPSGLQSLAAAVGARLVPALGGGAVYTDDRAAVEWLTDQSSLRYATGQR